MVMAVARVTSAIMMMMASEYADNDDGDAADDGEYDEDEGDYYRHHRDTYGAID